MRVHPGGECVHKGLQGVPMRRFPRGIARQEGRLVKRQVFQGPNQAVMVFD